MQYPWEIFSSPENEFMEVVAVVDQLEIRRENARKIFNCPVFPSYQDLFLMKDQIDLVVNASYSHFHYSITKDLMENGFPVLVEKPFGASYEECRELTQIATSKKIPLFAFHQTLLTPSFLNVKEQVKSGKLGRLIQINHRYSGFAHRWDWQTLQKNCAGSLYNTGPHPVGQALDLLDWDANVTVAFSNMQNILSSGDADDYDKIILTAPGKPIVDIEISPCDPYCNYTYKVHGTNGCLESTLTHWKMTYYDPTAYQKHALETESLADEDGNPTYCKDDMVKIEECGEITGGSFDAAVKEFYMMVYGVIKEGMPASITPDKAALVIKVIEQCHSQNPLEQTYF